MKTIKNARTAGEAHRLKTKAHGKHHKPHPKPKRTGLSSGWIRHREDPLEMGSWSYVGFFSPLIAALLIVLGPMNSRAADAGGGDMIECANLIYAGTKSSVCFSEEFLSAIAAETSICTARKFKPVKLAE